MGWILDLVFFLILLLGTAYGAYRGFVAGICKLAGTFFALIFAFTFCVAFSNFLELCFGMTTAIANGLNGAIAKNEAYAAAIGTPTVGAEIGEVLSGLEINAIAKWFIKISFRSVELIPAEATPAMMISSVLAKWIAIVIVFVILVVVIKLGALLITKVFNAVKTTLSPIRVVDQALGAVLGLAKAAVLIFILLLLLNWLPVASVHEFIASSSVVGKIFEAEWFQSATSYAISGGWFNDFVKKLFT